MEMEERGGAGLWGTDGEGKSVLVLCVFEREPEGGTHVGG